VAGKQDRQRKLARERYLRQQERRIERTRQIRQRTTIGASAAAVVAIAVGAYFLASSGPGSKASASSASASASAAAHASSAAASPSAAASTPTNIPPASPLAKVPAKAPATVTSHCTYTKSGTAARKVSLPPSKPDSSAKSKATITTNRGTIVIDLLNKWAPCTVNSFVSLSRQGFYNNTPCPRVVSSGIYVLQCGDPTGTGRGGPGYAFANENTTGATYPAGTLAMANSGGAASNGSQFFIVYAPGQLGPDYTPFGVVAKGLDIVRKVAEAGNNGNSPAGGGQPNEKINIERVKISSY
jgi:peptidyl-prolyl cis-trans isomerase B (cyclophilin B)